MSEGREVLGLTQKALIEVETNIGERVADQALAAGGKDHHSFDHICKVVTLIGKDIDHITNEDLADFLQKLLLHDSFFVLREENKLLKGHVEIFRK